MKVLLINGSPNKEGNTYLALKTCADEIEKNGVETEIFHIGSGPIQGCVACYACRRGTGCVLQDDVLPALVEKLKTADGLIIGSPTYFAGPNGSLCALLDRMFFSAGEYLTHKPGAAVAVCRRGGASATLDRLNKYFTIKQMPLVSSRYWNLAHGSKAGEVLQDAEGMQTMRNLGLNMAHMVKSLAAKEWPDLGEAPQMTNFIR